MEKRERDSDNDDVESNLLLPAGVALRWVTLQLKVFRAEDVPQSKPESHNTPLYQLIFLYIMQCCNVCNGERLEHTWFMTMFEALHYTAICFSPVLAE